MKNKKNKVEGNIIVKLTYDKPTKNLSGKLILNGKNCENNKERDCKKILFVVALVSLIVFSCVLLGLIGISIWQFAFAEQSCKTVMVCNFDNNNGWMLIALICCVTLLLIAIFTILTILALQKREKYSEKKSVEEILSNHRHLFVHSAQNPTEEKQNSDQNVDNSLTINIKGNITIDRKNDGDNE